MRGILASIIVALLLYAFTSCTKKEEGSLTGTAIKSTEVLVSQILTDQLKALDTIAIEDGTFSYNANVQEPEFLLLEFSAGMRVPLLIKPNEKIFVEVMDSSETGTFRATGSLSVERMSKQNQLFAQSIRFMDSLDYLNSIYQDSANYMDQRMNWDKAFLQRMEDHRAQIFAMLDEDSTDLANIMVFYQGSSGFEILRFPEDEAYYRKVDNGLLANYPNNKHAQYFHESLVQAQDALVRQERIEQAAKIIAVGQVAPEIALPDLEKNERKLSDLRGNVVLIDFWASWCAPCRRANPGLVSLYKKYKDLGFEIFSVSIDGLEQQPNPQQEWEMAIANDGLIWKNHVSDLLGYKSEVIESYGVSGIPYSILIDRNGNILAKNPNYSELDALLLKNL